jgi:hypothetical protein
MTDQAGVHAAIWVIVAGAQRLLFRLVVYLGVGSVVLN